MDFYFNRVRVALVASILINLVGCSTTQDGLRRINPYVGHHVDGFFTHFGMPSAVYEFSDKRRVYRWSSGQRAVYMPSVTSVSGSVGPTGLITGHAETFGGFTAKLECVIDLTTDSQGIVQQIRAVKDTWGAWETSRCAEVLR